MEKDCCELEAGLICFNEYQENFPRNRKSMHIFFEDRFKENK